MTAGNLVKNYGLAGVSNTIQLGKGGDFIHYSGSVFAATNDDAGGELTAANLQQFRIATTPTDQNDAASKKYVDDQIQQFIQGLDVKLSVRVATTASSDTDSYAYVSANETQGDVWTGVTSAPVIDGVTLVDGDRLLIKDAADARGNGIFTYNDTNDSFVRSIDADNSPENEVSGGMFTFIEEGASLLDTGWVMTSPNGIVSLGVDDMVFTQFSGAGAVTAGNGIDITGTVVSVDADEVTITFNGGGSNNQLSVFGGTSTQVLISAGGSNDAVWSYQGDLKTSTGELIIDGIDGGTSVAHLNVTTGTVANGAVQIGVGIAGEGGSNLDLELSAAGTGFVILPSGTSFAGAPGNALIDKDYVDETVAQLNFQIIDNDSDTFVRVETTDGSDEDYIRFDAGGSRQLTVGKPAGESGVGGSTTTTQSGTNYLYIFSSGDDAAGGTNDEIRIEAAGVADDIDIRLVPTGTGQVFIGDEGAGVIQADDNFTLTVLGGDSDGTAAGADLNLAGGDGASSFISGDVNLYGGSTSGGGANGSVNIQYQEDPGTQTNIAVFDGVDSAVNYFTFVSGATTEDIEIQATGGDGNIDIMLRPLGTGDVMVPSGYSPDDPYALVTKTYVDALVTIQDLDITADGGGPLSIDLDSQTLDIAGGTNITTAADTLTITVNLNSSIDLAGSLDVTTAATFDSTASFAGNVDINATLDVNETINLVDADNSGVVNFTVVAGTTTDVDLLISPAGTGAVLLPSGYSVDDPYSITTKAYVDALVTIQDLDFQGDSGGAQSVDLDSQTFSIVGTANEIETSSSGQTLTIGLPDDVTITGDLTVLGTTTTIDTTNMLIEDPLMVLSRLATGAATVDSGFIVERGSDTNVGFFYDESSDEFVMVSTTEDGTTAGNVSFTTDDFVSFRAGAAAFDNEVVIHDQSGDGSVLLSTSGDNTDIVLSVTGTGDVMVPSGYSPDDPFALVTKTFVEAVTLEFQANTGGELSINLNTETLTITGGTNIETVGSVNDVTISLSTNVDIAGTLDVTTAATFDSTASFAGNVDINANLDVDNLFNLVDAANDGIVNFTIVAGTATNVDLLITPAGTGNVMVPSGYVPDDAYALITKTYADGASLEFQGNTGGSLSINLLADTLTIAGGANIETVGSVNTLSISLSTNVDIAGSLDVTTAATFDSTASFAGNVDINAILDVNETINIVDSNNDGEGQITMVAGTATNVDLLISPAGTGMVMVPSGYTPTDPFALVTKSYVDSVATAQDLDFQGDSGGALSIDLDSEVLDIAGGTNITTAGATNTLTVNLDDNVDLAGTLDVTGVATFDNDVDLVDTDGNGVVNIGVTAGAATNVDLLITPAGTGDVAVPSGYTPDDPYSLVTKTYVDAQVSSGTDELTFRTTVATSAAKDLGTFPNVAGKDYYVTRIIVDVTTAFDTDPGGDRVSSDTGTNTIIDDTQIDVTTIGKYIVEVYDDAVDHGGLVVRWDAVTAATVGAATVTVEYKAFTVTA